MAVSNPNLERFFANMATIRARLAGDLAKKRADIVLLTTEMTTQVLLEGMSKIQTQITLLDDLVAEEKNKLAAQVADATSEDAASKKMLSDLDGDASDDEYICSS